MSTAAEQQDFSSGSQVDFMNEINTLGVYTGKYICCLGALDKPLLPTTAIGVYA